MKKDHVAVAGFIALLALLPVFASAITAEELAAQVQSLLAQIAALQQKLPQGSPATPTTTTGVCPSLSRTLSVGASGIDVTELQTFLANSGNFHANPTGFFGPVTQTAVQAWQSANGVVSSGDPISTGWGVVGARTRAAIAAKCANATPRVTPVATCPVASPPLTICSTGWQANTDANGCTTSYKCSIPLPGATPTSNVFSASPTSGRAPLTVTFSTNISNPTSYAAGVYQIDYGDGRTDGIAGCSLASVCSLDSGTHTHSYTAAGTYTARLIFINRSACTSSSVACTSGQETMVSVTITVGS